jgi:spermidine/putrescine transport system permease protein
MLESKPNQLLSKALAEMKNFGINFYLLCVYIFIYGPIAALIIYSVNDANFSLIWHGFTTKWYTALFLDDALWSSFYHSVALGTTVALTTTVMSLLICINIFLHPQKSRKMLNINLFVLVIIPDLVLGVSLLVFFNAINLGLGYLSLFIGHVTFALPFVILTIKSRIENLDSNIYYSALDLGASKIRALTNVLLPIIYPSIISAFFLCFTLSLDDVVISYFVSGPDSNILPITIYSLVRTGVTPELNALCAITILLSAIMVLISYVYTRKSI